MTPEQMEAYLQRLDAMLQEMRLLRAQSDRQVGAWERIASALEKIANK